MITFVAPHRDRSKSDMNRDMDIDALGSITILQAFRSIQVSIARSSVCNDFILSGTRFL